MTPSVHEHAEVIGHLERGIRGTPGIYPDWVYECREALKHARENPPVWLPDLLAALGWQSGTLHDALNAVCRLAAVEQLRQQREEALAKRNGWR